MGRAFRYQRRTSHIIVGVAEHHLAARDRAVEAAAAKASQKGVRGAVKKAREALVGQKKNTRRPKKEK
jgi:ribosomal protein L22